MEGWIKIHRQIKDNWLWKSERRLKWWLDILITVNHCDSKVLIKGSLVQCKRGQSVRSLDTWAKEWNVTKGAVRDFFKLLESDQMISTESLQFTTRITVCKYEDYQAPLHDKETQRKRLGNEGETQRVHKQECKEEKNDKNKEEEGKIKTRSLEFKKKIIDLKTSYPKPMLESFYSYWTEANRSNTKMRFELEPTFEVTKRLATWAKRDNQFKRNGNNGHTVPTVIPTMTTYRGD